MSGGAVGFMAFAWVLIIGASVYTLSQLVKHSK